MISTRFLQLSAASHGVQTNYRISNHFYRLKTGAVTISSSCNSEPLAYIIQGCSKTGQVIVIKRPYLQVVITRQSNRASSSEGLSRSTIVEVLFSAYARRIDITAEYFRDVKMAFSDHIGLLRPLAIKLGAAIYRLFNEFNHASCTPMVCAP
uniref:Uncharacterized protein n=1 Tax=Glossina palpalis gambiensis TaxID=67801 RepID=A0A1B0AXM4_9MUSC